MYIKRQREVSLCQGTSFRYTGSKSTAHREKDESINMPKKASIQQRIRVGEAKSCDSHSQGRVHCTSVTKRNANLFWKSRQHCLALGSSLLGFRISFMILLDEALPLLNCVALHVSPRPAWENTGYLHGCCGYSTPLEKQEDRKRPARSDLQST